MSERRVRAISSLAVLVALAAGVLLVATTPWVGADPPPTGLPVTENVLLHKGRTYNDPNAKQTHVETLIVQGGDAVTFEYGAGGVPSRLLGGSAPNFDFWAGTINDSRETEPINIVSPQKKGEPAGTNPSSIGCPTTFDPEDNPGPALMKAGLDICVPPLGFDYSNISETRAGAIFEQTGSGARMATPNLGIYDQDSERIDFSTGITTMNLWLRNNTSYNKGFIVEDPAEIRKAAWSENWLVALRFDDNLQAADNFYRQTFEKYGVRATYAINTNNDSTRLFTGSFPQDDDHRAQRYVALGWELCDHLPDHNHTTNAAFPPAPLSSGDVIDLMNETQADIDANLGFPYDVDTFCVAYGEDGALSDGPTVLEVASIFYSAVSRTSGGINPYPTFDTTRLTASFNEGVHGTLANFLEDARACQGNADPCLAIIGIHTELGVADMETLVTTLLAEGATFVTINEGVNAIVPRSVRKNLLVANKLIGMNGHSQDGTPQQWSETLSANAATVWSDDHCVSVTDTDGGSNFIIQAVANAALWEWEQPHNALTPLAGPFALTAAPVYERTTATLLVDVTTTGITGTGARVELAGATVGYSGYATGTTHSLHKVATEVPVASFTGTAAAYNVRLHVDGVTAGTVKFCRPTLRIDYPDIY